ncbi:MAG: hypothetical protein M3Y72_08125 [Acidobacteriota bacterium]|nr:hypothetical protein [Acidobacteriota bacterium]
MRSFSFSPGRGLWLLSGLVLAAAFQVAGQSPAALSQFFEGKQVKVGLDMPATQIRY